MTHLGSVRLADQPFVKRNMHREDLNFGFVSENGVEEFTRKTEGKEGPFPFTTNCWRERGQESVAVDMLRCRRAGLALAMEHSAALTAPWAASPLGAIDTS
jgi:hypothetical protein